MPAILRKLPEEFENETDIYGEHRVSAKNGERNKKMQITRSQEQLY